MQVQLVPYLPEFLDRFMEWRNEPASIRHNPLITVSREEASRLRLAEGSDLKDPRPFESYRWFIQADGNIVGSVSIKNINTIMNYAEIGYGVAEQWQGRGIATSAVGALVDKAFSESGLRKLIAFVHDQNFASCRVLDKLGFTREGFLREHYIINGRAENEVLFGLLRHERANAP